MPRDIVTAILGSQSGSGEDGSGGGSGSVMATVTARSPNVFMASIAEDTGESLVALIPENFLNIPAANVHINRGGFSVADDVSPGTHDHVVIPKTGTYLLSVNFYTQQTANENRTLVFGEFHILRGGSRVDNSDARFSGYNRGITSTGQASETAYVTGQIVVDLEANDTVEFRLSLEYARDDVEFTLGGTDSFISIAEIVGTPSISVSAGGVAELQGWRNPRAAGDDPYNVTDVGKFLVANREIKRIERDYHPGHAKTVGGTTRPGTWYVLGDNDEGGGDGAHFRGFHDRAGRVSDPQQGDFYASSVYFDFEIYHDGTGGTTQGWHGHNPFESGAYWDSVEVDGSSVTPSGTYYTAQDRGDAFDTASGAYETFVLRNAHEVIMSLAVVDAEEEYDHIRPLVWTPPASANPMGVWYGEGQSDKYAAPAAKTFLGSRYYRLTYANNAPDLHWAGGDSMGASVLDSADATLYDLLTRDSAAEARGDKKVMKLEPGRYRFKTRAFSSAEDISEMGLFMYEAVTGEDDFFLFAQSGRTTKVNDPFGTDETNNVRVVEFDEIFEVFEPTHYTGILVIEGDMNFAADAADMHLSFYTEIERLL